MFQALFACGGAACDFDHDRNIVDPNIRFRQWTVGGMKPIPGTRCQQHGRHDKEPSSPVASCISWIHGFSIDMRMAGLERRCAYRAMVERRPVYRQRVVEAKNH